MSSKQIDITYLNGPDVERLALSDDEMIAAVESALVAQGRGETVIEPRVHLIPESSAKGHFNILRGYVKPLGVAGVKIVSDFVDNYKSELPSEMALLNLFDPGTGMPLAVIDATAITDMRTGAMTALGARYLARKNSRILGHIGARGTAYWNVRLLDRLFDAGERRDNVYEHVWRPGDLVMWDNFASMHARTDFPSTERRLMRRCAIGRQPVAGYAIQ